MHFKSFVIACLSFVLASQVVYVSTRSAGTQEEEKSISQLEDDFNKLSSQMQGELNSAKERTDLKKDAHAQAYLNKVEEMNGKISQMTKIVTNISTREQFVAETTGEKSPGRQLSKNIAELGIQLEEEYKKVGQEFQSDEQLRRIEGLLGKVQLGYLNVVQKKVQSFSFETVPKTTRVKSGQS